MRSSVIIFFIALMAFQFCHSPKSAGLTADTKCVTGTLAIKGICGQRVISILDGDTTGLQVNPMWVNPGGGDTLKNVFSVSNICDFPSTVNVGDTIKFQITAKEDKECITCKAYTPVPEEKNKIEMCE